MKNTSTIIQNLREQVHSLSTFGTILLDKLCNFWYTIFNSKRVRGESSVSRNMNPQPDPMAETWVDWDEPLFYDDGTSASFVCGVLISSKNYRVVIGDMGLTYHQRNGRPRNNREELNKRWVVNHTVKHPTLQELGLVD